MNLQKSALKAEGKTSPQQKKFQQLSQKIEQEKAHLAAWQLAQTEISTRLELEMSPAYQQLRQIIFQQVEQLLKQKHKKMTRRQLNKLDGKIEELALQLVQSQQMPEQQMRFLTELLESYGHHNGEIDQAQADFEKDFEQEFEPDFENSNAAEFFQLKIVELKALLCAEYDLAPDFFDFEADDLDDFMQKFHDKMQQQDELEFSNHFSGQEHKQFEQEIEREKARATKKIQQREQAKKNATLSMKAIYLKIVAMIHPDREQDEQKKLEKTVLLQKVNQAYENKDLLPLLAYQVELGQQQNQLLANQQLKAYNLVLEEQLEKISIEIERIIDSFHWHAHLRARHNRTLKVKDLHENYERNWLAVKEEILRSEKVLAAYKDTNTLKALMNSQDLWEMH